MKKRISLFLVITLVLTTLFNGNAGTKVDAAASLKSKYIAFVRQEMKKGRIEENPTDCYMYDFNKDGVKELVALSAIGARALYNVYTYKNGKVKYLTDGNDIGYIKGKKYLVSYGSGGYQDFGYNVYTISGGKLKKAFTCECEAGVYKKNKKKITENEFNKFSKTVVTNLGKGFKVTKETYYSPKQIGFDITKISVPKETMIDKVTSSKITYHTESWNFESGKLLSKSKKKSATFTTKTKYYYGDVENFFKLGVDANNGKWIKKLSKADFLKKMKTYKDAPNVVKVKNGKVTYVVINLHIAD